MEGDDKEEDSLDYQNNFIEAAYSTANKNVSLNDFYKIILVLA